MAEASDVITVELTRVELGRVLEASCREQHTFDGSADKDLSSAVTKMYTALRKEEREKCAGLRFWLVTD